MTKIQINEYQLQVVKKVAAFKSCTIEFAAEQMWNEQVQDFAALLERIEDERTEAVRRAFYVVK